MKKLFLLLSIVFMVGIAKAQTQLEWWQPSTKQWLIVADSTYYVGNQYFGALPVSIKSGNITATVSPDTSNAWIQNLIKTNTTNTATIARQDSTINYLSSLVTLAACNLMRTFHDTLSTRVDTVTRKIAGDTTNNLNYIFVGDRAWQGDITVNDTVEISGDATFPANKTTIVYPNTQPGLPLFKRSLFYNPNLYIRRYVTTGGTGTVTIDFRIWGY